MEIRKWQLRARCIPDPPIREDALRALSTKRTHLHGAALFWTLPRRRDLGLLRLLVAYELIWDFLDNLNERTAHAGTANGRQLHLAIAEAVDPHGPISDYYKHSPWRRDGGYLRALVESCREGCLALPSFERVRDLVVQAGRRADVLALNHDPDPRRREELLAAWVQREHPAAAGAFWWELSGAASAPLTVLALLAVAAEEDCTERDVAAVHAAYSPWLSAATTMLDSFVDQIEDVENGDHSYVEHYPDRESARRRIGVLVHRAVAEARALRNGSRHAVIAAAMTAMYLSKASARSPSLRAGTRGLVRSGGSLTRLLLPILKLWRIVFAQRTA